MRKMVLAALLAASLVPTPAMAMRLGGGSDCDFIDRTFEAGFWDYAQRFWQCGDFEVGR